MPNINFKCVQSIEPDAKILAAQQQKLQPNAKDAYLEASRILLLLLENVLKEPNNPKYRTVRLENKTIKDKLLARDGSTDLLLAIGFQRTPTEFVLPQDVPLDNVKEYKQMLEQRRDMWMKGIVPATCADASSFNCNAKVNGEQRAAPPSSASGSSTAVTRTTVQGLIQPTVPFRQRISFPRVVTSPNPFLQALENFSDAVMQYEDAKLLEAGRSLVPIDDLTQKASERFIALQEEIAASKCKEHEPCIRDLILVELVNWFNTEFFEWVNNMPCKVCGSEESKLRRIQTEGDIRVEIGFCCGQETKFYRYNDIAQLLVTRKGRCGEYANCFTFLCRCLDYEARIVHSFFDHVWTEVYSESQQRWLHVDPSDNVIDSPLMYQHGWKRNIDYVFALSCDDVQDVTWRYTNNHKEVLKMRNQCSEMDLVKAILALRLKRQAKVSAARKKELAQRALKEIIELTVEREPTENECKGRSSGSLAWRHSRGEHNYNDIYVFKLNEEELQSRQFNVRYSCAMDLYERYIKVDSTTLIRDTYKTWQSVQFSSQNIFRKVERDWKMVYLARQEGTDHAEIVWKFDFCGLKVKSYKLHLEKKTFGEGRVEVFVTTADGNTKIEGVAQELQIRAVLSGGKGDVAWQHTQLFRQSLSSKDYAFQLEVEFI